MRGVTLVPLVALFVSSADPCDSSYRLVAGGDELHFRFACHTVCPHLTVVAAHETTLEQR